MRTCRSVQLGNCENRQLPSVKPPKEPLSLGKLHKEPLPLWELQPLKNPSRPGSYKRSPSAGGVTALNAPGKPVKALSSPSQAKPYPLSTPSPLRLSDRVFSPSKPRAVFSFRTRSTFLNTGPQPIPPSPPLEAPKVDGQSCRFRAKSVARPVRSNPRDQPEAESSNSPRKSLL